MAKYEVEWSISARGVYDIDAVDDTDASELVGMVPLNELVSIADRVDWETNPIKKKENK